MKIGNHIRDKKHVKDANKKKVQTVKTSKADEQMALPITTKQIDGSMLMDADISTQRSSTNAFYSAEKNGAKVGNEAPSFAIKRGRSQQMNTAPIGSHATIPSDKARRKGAAMSASRL